MSSKYGRNVVTNDPREATMNIPFDLARTRGAREVDRGTVSGLRASTVKDQVIASLNGRLYYLYQKHAENWKLAVGSQVKVSFFEDKYYFAVIPERRAVSREIQLLQERSKNSDFRYLGAK